MTAHATNLSGAPQACRTLAPAVETYLDGELGPSQMVEVEAHLSQCGTCRERVALDRATRVSLRRPAPTLAPASLRDRVRARMAAERQEQVERAAEARGALHDSGTLPVASPVAQPSASSAPALAAPSAPSEASTPPGEGRSGPISTRRFAPRPARPMRARYALPFAVAAGVAFAISMRKVPPSPMDTSPSAARGASAEPASIYNTASMTGLDGILDELVSLHASPLPPEVTHPDDVRNFDPFVGVPVEAPKLSSFGAKWVGGRMLPIRDSRAAMLQYSLAGGHRITVYVYDPHRIKQESRTLQARMVRNAPVFVGNVRGYNVAATERKGIGYAVATDLDEPESMELMAASVPLRRAAAERGGGGSASAAVGRSVTARPVLEAPRPPRAQPPKVPPPPAGLTPTPQSPACW